MTALPVELLPIAQEDVNQILITIRADNPPAAEKWLDRLLEGLEQASRFLFSAAEIVVGKRMQRYYFRLYIRPYHVYYRVINNTIVVMRVLHERMDREKHLI